MSVELPKWADDEIKSIKDSSFKPLPKWEGTGYFLDIFDKERRADIQLYEKVPPGQHIITADIPNEIKMDDLLKGFVYAYKVKILKASLSNKLSKYLKESLNMHKEGVYLYEIESLEMLDVDGGLASSSDKDDLED